MCYPAFLGFYTTYRSKEHSKMGELSMAVKRCIHSCPIEAYSLCLLKIPSAPLMVIWRQHFTARAFVYHHRTYSQLRRSRSSPAKVFQVL